MRKSTQKVAIAGKIVTKAKAIEKACETVRHYEEIMNDNENLSHLLTKT